MTAVSPSADRLHSSTAGKGRQFRKLESCQEFYRPMSVRLNITTQWSTNVEPKTYTCLRGNRKRAKQWNGELFAWVEGAGFKHKDKITVAGPPNCEDRPWWWGRSIEGGN